MKFSRQKDALDQRRQAYERVFDRRDPDVRIVLQDLIGYSRFLDAPETPDPMAREIVQGRRDVMGRILEHLAHNPDELLQLYHLRGLNNGGAGTGPADADNGQ